MRKREIREARIDDAATKIRVFFLSFLLETVFVEPARTRYTKVSTDTPEIVKFRRKENIPLELWL